MIQHMAYLISTLPKDKILHFLVAYIISDISFNTFYTTELTILYVLCFSFAITTAIMFAKETSDLINTNRFDWYDILAGYIGFIVNLIINLLLLL